MSSVNAIRVRDVDSCATCITAIKKGDAVTYRAEDESIHQVIAGEDIPAWHKIATADIPQGEYVYKYGERIGVAEVDIPAGGYVHVHNIRPVGYQEVQA